MDRSNRSLVRWPKLALIGSVVLLAAQQGSAADSEARVPSPDEAQAMADTSSRDRYLVLDRHCRAGDLPGRVHARCVRMRVLWSRVETLKRDLRDTEMVIEIASELSKALSEARKWALPDDLGKVEVHLEANREVLNENITLKLRMESSLLAAQQELHATIDVMSDLGSPASSSHRPSGPSSTP